MHWLARPSPWCLSCMVDMLYHKCVLPLHPAVVHLWINPLSEGNAKMENFGINMCPGFHHDQYLVVRYALTLHCQVDSLEDVTSHQKFSRV